MFCFYSCTPGPPCMAWGIFKSKIMKEAIEYMFYAIVIVALAYSAITAYKTSRQ